MSRVESTTITETVREEEGERERGTNNVSDVKRRDDDGDDEMINNKCFNQWSPSVFSGKRVSE